MSFEPEPVHEEPEPTLAHDAPDLTLSQEELTGEAAFDEAERVDKEELHSLQMELIFDEESDEERLQRWGRIAELQKRLGDATAPRMLKCAICFELLSVADKDIIFCI